MPVSTPIRLLSRPALAFAAALTLTAGAGVATAQTVIVTHAPAGAAVELVFNSTRVQAATADDNGEATLTFALPAGELEADVRVSTEHCGDTRRVLLVERGLQPPPVTGACDRRDIPDVFAVQRVTTFVIDVQQPVPGVHLRQGPVPPFWLGREGESEAAPPPRFAPAPRGFYALAGGGVALPNNFSSTVCGTATNCTSASLKGAVIGGVGYWLKPVLGVEASYLKSASPSATGSGDGYSFSSSRKSDVVMLTGLVGGPIGGVRIYGRGGATYHKATLSTSQTIDVSGTQNFELKTVGWGWVAAGGVEVWVKSFLGVYVDGGFAKLMGSGLGGVQGSMDEQLIFATVGVRLHVGR